MEAEATASAIGGSTAVEEDARNLQNLETSSGQNGALITPNSAPLQVPLLLTYNDSKGEAYVQEPSMAIVKVSTNDDTKKLANIEAPRVLPCVGAFTVQCALCLKWRLIPTKEQYEEIRQSVLEKPFFCSSTIGWRPDASCEDPSDVLQDESHLWAIDRPNIPVAPRGWERQLVIRAAGASKFADVYYVAPSGRKLRSLPEVERFLAEKPEFVKAGLKQSQFSFIIPRPLDSNYCRKKTGGSSSPVTNSSEKQKLPSTSKSKKLHGNKLSAKRKAFESLSSKEGSEEQANSKKNFSVVAQKSEKGLGEVTSYEALISQQVVKGLLPPEELTKGLSWGFSLPNSGKPDHVSALATSEGPPAASTMLDTQLQDGESPAGQRQALLLGKKQSTSTELIPVHSSPSADTSLFQEKPMGVGS